MNRKNVILIAVLINAGLLAVLLIAALTTQEETLPPTQIAGGESFSKFEEKPIFQDALPVEPLKPVDLPVTASEPEPVVHPLPPLLPETAPVAVLPPPPAPLYEISVKKGDSLEKIAKANRTTVDEIIKINQLPSSFLKVGQVLKVPVERSLPKLSEKKAVEKIGPEYYTMKVGDNPWAIAMKHHMRVEELLRLNGLNEEKARKLKPGDRLRIR